MAYWQQSSISNIYTGASPNDGTGDPIRDAFIKVDYNFSNIASQLQQTNQDWYNGNVQYTLNAGNLNVGYVATIPSTIGGISNYSGNLVANIINSNAGIYNGGVTSLIGNTYAGNISASSIQLSGVSNLYGTTIVHNAVVPSANLSYDLGSPINFFRNIYVGSINQINTVNLTSDAGLLVLHANLNPGDIKDVGIFGKYNENNSNAYAFFGYQHASDSFVYKQTATDVTQGNSIVWNGIYGNTQFGSQYLSNTTPSTSTTSGALIVAGGVGVAGSLYADSIVANHATITNFSINSLSGDLAVGGSITSAGYSVITTNPNLGLGSFFNGSTAALITGNSVFVANVYVGNLIANSGGTIYGNITGNVNNLSTSSNVATFYTLNLPSPTSTINSSGTINASAIQASSIGVQNLSISGSFSVPTLQVSTAVLPTANLTANIGSPSLWFNKIYGTASHALYADLAEKYLADRDYPTGTVVAVGGDAEVTACQPGDIVIGVVSENPAYMMNSGLEGGTYIALKGRVPVFVDGIVSKGQRLIAGVNGCAHVGLGETFAVALESNNNYGIKLVEAVIL
jgi:hypothetical protein